jgi:hypothetical protein
MSHAMPNTARRLHQAAAVRRQRGAVLIEAAIVSGLLMTLFAGAVFFHRIYSAKIQSIREARLAAWQAAEVGCDSLLGLPQVANLVPFDDCLDFSCSLGGLGVESEQAPDWLESLGAKTGEGTNVVVSPTRIGGQSYAMAAHNRVICNERNRSERGDILSLFGYILDPLIAD